MPTKIRPKHPVTPKPPGLPPPPPPVDPLALTGTVRSSRPGSTTAFGIPWSDVTRWEPAFTDAAHSYGFIDVAILYAMAVLESNAQQYTTSKLTGTKAQVVARDDGFGDGVSVGIMQVKPRIWQGLVPSADAYIPAGNIRLGAAVLSQAIDDHGGSWQEAIRKVYFPADDPNGTTQDEYVQTITSLMAEVRSNTAPPPITPPITPPPATLVEPIRVITGGRAGAEDVQYGFGADAGLNYYSYGQGHGTRSRTQHPGVDVPIPDETPLFTPINGVVECLGAQGTPRWGQGCGFYDDYTSGPVHSGNLTIYDAASGLKLTLGHCSRFFVNLGQRVKAGDKVAASGGMNGPHCHVETSIYAPQRIDWSIALNGGDYYIVEPVAALALAMGGHAPATYVDPVDISQPDDAPPYVVVKATKATPVLQRGNPAGEKVAPDLKLGDEFFAQHRVLGIDGRWYWIGRFRGRVAEADTAVVKTILE